MKNVFFFVFSVLASTSYAQPFHALCPDLDTCVKNIGEMTGERYMFGREEIKCAVKSSVNLEVTKENASVLFTSFLNQCGLSRVPMGIEKGYRIERLSDAKGMNLPTYFCDREHAPKIPPTWDAVRVQYKMTHPEGVKNLEFYIRTYSSMGARIYAHEGDGTLTIVDSGMQVLGIYELMKSKDVKVSPETLKRWNTKEPKAESKSQSG